MSGRNAKDVRHQARGEAAAAVSEIIPRIDAALKNESITRVRVEALEKALGETIQHQDVLTRVIRQRTLLGRLRWLVSGR